MITRLAVKNYRSLEDIDLRLGPLAVLIGANGSGKSNVLDVLRLVHDLIVGRIEVGTAFGRRGGFKEIVWGGDTERSINVRVELVAGASQGLIKSTYEVRFVHDRRENTVLEHEGVWTEAGDRLIRDNQGRVGVTGASDIKPFNIDTRTSVLADRHVAAGVASDVVESIGEWAFHRFDPVRMRTPQPVRRERRLAGVGENLATVVHTLFSDRDPALAEIVDFLIACVPTVQELRSPITDDGLTYVALKEDDVPTAIGSWGLSDGTLLALALATALVTPHPPGLLALEAPDTELHPHVMETLADMLRLAAKKTQVIATTHSPYLLDFLPRKSFVVFEKEEGATRCKPLKGRRGVQKVLDELGAGRAWYSGHLGGVP